MEKPDFLKDTIPGDGEIGDESSTTHIGDNLENSLKESRRGELDKLSSTEEERRNRAIKKRAVAAYYRSLMEGTRKETAKRGVWAIDNWDVLLGIAERIAEAFILMWALYSDAGWSSILLVIVIAVGLWMWKIKSGEGPVIQKVRSVGKKEIRQAFISLSKTIYKP